MLSHSRRRFRTSEATALLHAPSKIDRDGPGIIVVMEPTQARPCQSHSIRGGVAHFPLAPAGTRSLPVTRSSSWPTPIDTVTFKLLSTTTIPQAAVAASHQY
jgi:hypothetical protein